MSISLPCNFLYLWTERGKIIKHSSNSQASNSISLPTLDGLTSAATLCLQVSIMPQVSVRDLYGIVEAANIKILDMKDTLI